MRALLCGICFDALKVLTYLREFGNVGPKWSSEDLQGAQPTPQGHWCTDRRTEGEEASPGPLTLTSSRCLGATSCVSLPKGLMGAISNQALTLGSLGFWLLVQVTDPGLCRVV